MIYLYLQLDIQLNFESQSYAVSDKNLAEEPVIWIKYPKEYVASKMFPIIIDVKITNITAKGKLLHMHLHC